MAMKKMMKTLKQGNYSKPFKRDPNAQIKSWRIPDGYIVAGDPKKTVENIRSRYTIKEKDADSIAQYLMSKVGCDEIEIPTGRSQFFQRSKEQGDY